MFLFRIVPEYDYCSESELWLAMKLVDSDGVLRWLSFLGSSSENFSVNGVMIVAERYRGCLVRCESGLSFGVGSIFLVWPLY